MHCEPIGRENFAAGKHHGVGGEESEGQAPASVQLGGPVRCRACALCPCLPSSPTIQPEANVAADVSTAAAARASISALISALDDARLVRRACNRVAPPGASAVDTNAAARDCAPH